MGNAKSSTSIEDVIINELVRDAFLDQGAISKAFFGTEFIDTIIGEFKSEDISPICDKMNKFIENYIRAVNKYRFNYDYRSEKDKEEWLLFWGSTPNKPIMASISAHGEYLCENTTGDAKVVAENRANNTIIRVWHDRFEKAFKTLVDNLIEKSEKTHKDACENEFIRYSQRCSHLQQVPCQECGAMMPQFVKASDERESDEEQQEDKAEELELIESSVAQQHRIIFECINAFIAGNILVNKNTIELLTYFIRQILRKDFNLSYGNISQNVPSNEWFARLQKLAEQNKSWANYPIDVKNHQNNKYYCEPNVDESVDLFPNYGLLLFMYPNSVDLKEPLNIMTDFKSIIALLKKQVTNEQQLIKNQMALDALYKLVNTKETTLTDIMIIAQALSNEGLALYDGACQIYEDRFYMRETRTSAVPTSFKAKIAPSGLSMPFPDSQRDLGGGKRRNKMARRTRKKSGRLTSRRRKRTNSNNRRRTRHRTRRRRTR
jgi:hypothetical protein